jgi:hypothetical protein
MAQKTAHSLFNYLVEEEDDVDNQDCPQCNFNKQQSDFSERGVCEFSGMSLFLMIEC